MSVVKTGGSEIPALPGRSAVKRIRAFVALRFDSEAERKLASLIVEEQRPGDGVAWVRPTNLHLTLRFLGDAAEMRLVTDLAAELRAVVSAHRAFGVRLRSLGVFPDLGRPRTFWVGLDSPHLAPLAASVEDAARRCGFAPESRPFKPHLTLARIRGGSRADRVRHILERRADSDFGESQVDRVILYRSHLRPDGSRYEQLASFALTASDNMEG